MIMEAMLMLYATIAVLSSAFLFWIKKTKSGKKWLKNL